MHDSLYTQLGCRSHIFVLNQQGSTVGSFLFAVFGWLIGALGHDAGHFAASRSAPLNDWGVWGMSLLCNPILWQHQHTYGHHSYTNEFDHDPDLHHFDTLLRCHRRIQQQSLYKYQSNCVYVTLAYTMVVFGTCFWIPLGMIQEGSLYGLVEWTDRKRPWRTFGLYAHLITYVGLIMVVPFWTHASRWGAVGAASLHIATSGLIFAIFSQINHLNEPSLDTKERERLKQSRDPRLAASWAVNQVETANNFASGSTLWHILSNGLNYQIEHHLFPGVNHCHLHHIAPTVRATCEEFGVCYKSYESWNDTMQATLDWLDKLSVEPELVATEKKAVAVVASKQQ
jgi:fatty acid desaturase